MSTNEDIAYIFETGDFGFGDADGDTLDHVKITSLPGTGKGNLSLNDATIGSADLPKEVNKEDLDDSKLAYTPPDNANGDGFARSNSRSATAQMTA